MPWQKGQSGNPGGRPKRKPVTEALLKELERRAVKGGPTQAQRVAAVIADLMLAGDVAAIRVGLGYAEGLPAQPHEVGGADGGPLEVIIRRVAGRGDAGDGPA